MSSNVRWLRHQGPNLAALGRVAASSLRGAGRGAMPATPTAPLRAAVPARDDALIDAYVRWCGADPATYRTTVPPHMFPQWGFPLLSRTLADLPLKLTSVLNQGCRLEVRGAVPRGQDLQLVANLVAIDDDGHKVRLHQRLVTGTADAPELLLADVFAVVVRGRGPSATRSPDDTAYTDVATWHAGARDGLDFALLTGDFNPIHWLPPAAKAAGFAGCILHGFGTLARTWEVLAREAGGPLPVCDVRFVRPLVLPATATVQTADTVDQEVPFRVRSGDTTVAAGLSVSPSTVRTPS